MKLGTTNMAGANRTMLTYMAVWRYMQAAAV